jgi:hypothetical protein
MAVVSTNPTGTEPGGHFVAPARQSEEWDFIRLATGLFLMAL